MLAGSAAWLDAAAVAALDPGGTSRARMRCSFQSPRWIRQDSSCRARVAIPIRAIFGRGAQRQRTRRAVRRAGGRGCSSGGLACYAWKIAVTRLGITMALRRAAAEGVLDLRPGPLEVAVGLVTAALGPQAPGAGDPAVVFLALPLTASALCAIFVAMLTGLSLAGHSAGGRVGGDICGGDTGAGLRGEGLCRADGGLRVAGSVPEQARPAPARGLDAGRRPAGRSPACWRSRRRRPRAGRAGHRGPG